MLLLKSALCIAIVNGKYLQYLNELQICQKFLNAKQDVQQKKFFLLLILFCDRKIIFLIFLPFHVNTVFYNYANSLFSI